MRKNSLAIIAALGVSLPAMAFAVATDARSVPFSNPASSNPYNVLEGVALNASAGTRTLSVALGRKWRKLKVNVFYTYGSATTLTAVSSCSLDGTNFGTINSRAISAGTSTLSTLTDTKTTGAANQTINLEFDVEACTDFNILFGGAGAGASDLINVQAAPVSGG